MEKTPEDFAGPVSLSLALSSGLKLEPRTKLPEPRPKPSFASLVFRALPKGDDVSGCEPKTEVEGFPNGLSAAAFENGLSDGLDDAKAPNPSPEEKALNPPPPPAPIPVPNDD
jgi:hypothetical protein